MNMMSVLLGATGLLLVAAFALSFGSLKNGTVSDASQAELAALRAEISSLKLQEEQLLALRQGSVMNTLTNPTPAPAVVVPETVEIDEEAILAAENEALKNQIANLEEKVSESEKKVDVYRDEAGLVGQKMIESHDKDQRRMRLIQEALLIATVTEWAEEDGYAVVTIQRPDLVQEGAVLGIRRNNGVLGQVKVSQMYEGGQAIADPHIFPNGLVDIQPGDELIVPPL